MASKSTGGRIAAHMDVMHVVMYRIVLPPHPRYLLKTPSWYFTTHTSLSIIIHLCLHPLCLTSAHLSTNSDLRREILPNIQLHQTLLLLNHQALLIRQMQQADKAVACRDIIHSLFWIYALQVLHDGCEL